MELKLVRKVVFILGLVLAVVLAVHFWRIAGGWGTFALIVLGFILGFLCISKKETYKFLIAAIALVSPLVVAYLVLNSILPADDVLIGVPLYIATFITPAAFVLALKTIWSFLAKD
jgi:hypothetical protein